jgi:cell division septum initiation protein DivIVA
VEIEWLDRLEARVRDAVARLGEMKEENRTLRERIEELEGRLAAHGGDAGDGAGAWAAEREEVRRRVEALAERLEGLAAG